MPATILIASVILGGFYYASEVNKQKSIERQQEIKLEEERRIEAKIESQKNDEALQKRLCVSEAQQNAIELNQDGDQIWSWPKRIQDLCITSRGVW